jgi:GTP pyrophosphokinase
MILSGSCGGWIEWTLSPQGDTMAGSSSIGNKYDDNLPRLNRLCEEVRFIMGPALLQAGIGTYSVKLRVKDRDSFLDKVQRFGYADPIIEMPDLVGARVVCLFLPDLPRLQELVERHFNVLDRRDHVAGRSVDTFGYMSKHYICQLPSSHTGPRYDDLKNLVFEVQCRTILMDAWANVSHVLAYKNEESIPPELRRDFHALAGLFYVADRHFQTFFESSVREDVKAERAVRAEMESPTASSVALNAGTLFALLQELYSDRDVTKSDASELLPEIIKLGYTSIRDLRRALENVRELAETYEREAPQDVRFAAIGMVRNSLGIIHPEYRMLVAGGKRRRRMRNPRHDEFHRRYIKIRGSISS